VTVPGDPGRELRVWIPGWAAPQGSKRPVGRRRNGSTILIESSKRLKPWRARARDAAIIAWGGREPLDGPVAVSLAFVMPRLPSYRKTGTIHAVKKPDVDKLIRAVLDALSDAGVWVDDSQVTTLERVTKRVAEPGQPSGVQVRASPDRYV
jgi:crossover junction endodeoxyribonuclease RusA